MTELTKRRVRSIYKLVRIGKIYTLVVLGVNEEKGFIDLSKKRVDATTEERSQPSRHCVGASQAWTRHAAW